MDWFRDQMKKGMNPRTYVLVAFLVLVLVWIHSLDQKRRAIRARTPIVTVAATPTALMPPKAAVPGDERASLTPWDAP